MQRLTQWIWQISLLAQR